MYAKINNEAVETYPYSIGDLRRDNPNVSFPRNLDVETLNAFGVYTVAATATPDIDHTQRVNEGTPTLESGSWVQTWVVEDISAEELAALTERRAGDMRNTRNGRLAGSDWTQISDAPVDAAVWAVYRQALRDVTDQAGFPWSIEWPTKPE